MLALVLGAVLALEDAPAPAVLFGAELFGEHFPKSTVEVPGMKGVYQQSVLTGGRLTLGVQHQGVIRGLLVLELGYAAAGLKAGNGQDGMMAGLGAEGGYVVHEWLIPFVRFTGDFRVWLRATPRTGTLTDRAFVFSLGVRALRVVELHASVGNDFAGGFAFGLGVGFGWQWIVPTG